VENQQASPSKIVYYHDPHGERRRIRETQDGTSGLFREDTVNRFTAAVDCPSPQTLLLAMEQFLAGGVVQTAVVVGLGLAQVHPRDNFNKDMGRKFASGRMKYEPMPIRDMQVYDSGRMHVTVESSEGYFLSLFYIRDKKRVLLSCVSRRHSLAD